MDINSHYPAIMGSPAHAGIDLRFHDYLLLANRFPRTRGDRPDRHIVYDPLQEVPPHTRG